jgi:hypothetical protein
MAADIQLIKRALQQADERISEWENKFQGDLYAANTRELLNLAIQEAEKLQ